MIDTQGRNFLQKSKFYYRKVLEKLHGPVGQKEHFLTTNGADKIDANTDKDKRLISSLGRFATMNLV